MLAACYARLGVVPSNSNIQRVGWIWIQPSFRQLNQGSAGPGHVKDSILSYHRECSFTRVNWHLKCLNSMEEGDIFTSMFYLHNYKHSSVAMAQHNASQSRTKRFTYFANGSDDKTFYPGIEPYYQIFYWFSSCHTPAKPFWFINVLTTQWLLPFTFICFYRIIIFLN